MSSCRIAGLLSAALFLNSTAYGDEVNLWPIFVQTPQSTEALGPLVFAKGDTSIQKGVRPIWREVRTDTAEEFYFLYPLFSSHQQTDYRSFSVFQLINFQGSSDHEKSTDQRFDIWPFYYSRASPDPALSYRALFPLGGELRNRFGKDQISFSLFPLYLHTEKSGRQVTHAPWPFLRFISGAGHEGFEFWPLFGKVARAGDYERQFIFWPLLYKSVTHQTEDIPEIKFGALPFYTRDTGPGYISENFAWPFFGYTHRTAPYRYDERRYFWPLLVQARGEDRYINRWAPFYSHSTIKGSDKRWILWPLFRNQQWRADGLSQEQNQFLFFLYSSLEQKSLTNPSAASAHKTHLWPLFSSWDNGAGRRQIQALSPFDVFFPDNENIRELWSPLFSLYRYNRDSSTAMIRHSLFWNALTYQKTESKKDFRLGPLLRINSDPTSKRIAFCLGLFGVHREVNQKWRFFLFDFHSNSASKGTTDNSP